MIDLKLRKELLPHQIDCINKLDKLKVGANFMDMGTGKTLTMLGLIKRKFKKIDKVIWFCPVSTMENLIRTIDENSNFLDYDFIEFFGIESISQSDRIYLQILRIVEKYNNIMLIIDESTLVKNYFAKRTERLTYIAAHCKYKFLMNGTPVTRSITDLFSQFYILDHRIIGYASYYSFANNHLIKDDFGKVVRVLDEDYIMQRITPYTFKIKKDECLDLPRRYFDVYYFSLTTAQMEHYQDIKLALLGSVDEFNSTTIYKLFTGLQLIASGRYVHNKDFLKECMTSKDFFRNVEDNPRIKALLNIVNQEEEQTIVWCKYTHEIKAVIEVLEKYYGTENVCKFYGEISLNKRATELKKFKEGARFLVGNKSCGGFGLNLQHCNRVIYYNNDFNWGTRQQSLDRVYRIGQEEKVYVTDICASFKIDEIILENLEKKERLDETFNRKLREYNTVDIDEWIDERRKKGKGRRNGYNRVKEIAEATRDTEVHRQSQN